MKKKRKMLFKVKLESREKGYAADDKEGAFKMDITYHLPIYLLPQLIEFLEKTNQKRTTLPH